MTDTFDARDFDYSLGLRIGAWKKDIEQQHFISKLLKENEKLRKQLQELRAQLRYKEHSSNTMVF